ncbi:MAG TPA: DUF742 domain-containing protein [Pseudonocardia sp.]|nr:DUF742 domain-containing protein [Pseudonocardia sp.]
MRPPDDEDDVGRAPRVRPFLLTGGRAVRHTDLSMETQVVSRSRDPHLRFERGAICELAQSPLSVAEIAARLDLHLGVVRVLVSEMHAAGHLDVYGASSDVSRDVDLLQRVIHGLRSLA